MTVLPKIRSMLLYLCAAAMLGTGIELLLMEHTAEFNQLIPLILIAIGLISILVQLIMNNSTSIVVLKAAMSLIIISGLVGIILHYNSNMEFAMEISPDLSGFDLFVKTIKGTTPPTLAPGNMSLLGLLGLLYTYKFNN